MPPRSEAPNTHGLDIHIVGAGNSAGQAALFFSSHARTVTLLCRGDALEKSMSQYLVDQVRRKPNIAVEVGAEVVGVNGGVEARGDRGRLAPERPDDDERVRRPLHLHRRRCRHCVAADRDRTRQARLCPHGRRRGCERSWPGDERDPFLLETSVPGIFAAGDVRFSPVKRVAAAVGDGSMAIAFVHQYLRIA